MSLILQNCYKADESVVRSIQPPAATETFQPIGHGRFLDLIEAAVDRAGFEIEDRRLALAGPNGQRLFGEFLIKGELDGYQRAVGFRHGTDRSLPASIVYGSQVMVCGNMCFAGEHEVRNRHTKNVITRLEKGLYEGLAKYQIDFEKQMKVFAQWKQTEITTPEVDLAIMACYRACGIPASCIPAVLREYDQPRHPEFVPRTAYSLFQAFTQVYKARKADPSAIANECIATHRVFRGLFRTQEMS